MNTQKPTEHIWNIYRLLRQLYSRVLAHIPRPPKGVIFLITDPENLSESEFQKIVDMLSQGYRLRMPPQKSKTLNEKDCPTCDKKKLKSLKE